jgi:hypothetical protein
MDDQSKLKSLFPRGSKSFFEANETKTITKLSYADVKSNKTATLDPAIQRKKESSGRATVRYRLCRVRPLDPDNATGSTKDLTDALCLCGLLQGDDPTKITLIVEQERVKSYSDERTEIEIEWPEDKT